MTPFKVTILLVCAHKWEAKPFVRAQSCELSSEHTFPFEVYRGKEDFTLLVTGQGSLSAATATASFLSHCDHKQPVLVANFGLAGGHHNDWEIGCGLLVHRVTDLVTQRSIYPDALLQHGWEEAPCLTVPSPATSEQYPHSLDKRIYDMEAYGVCRAAERYVPSSHLLVGKFLSDHLQSEVADWKELRETHQESYTRACQDFLHHAKSHHSLLAESPRRQASVQAQDWWQGCLEELTQILPLTVTQERQLKSRLHAFALGAQGLEPLQTKRQELLHFARERKGETKSEHSKVLEGLLHLLATPPLFSPLR